MRRTRFPAASSERMASRHVLMIFLPVERALLFNRDTIAGLLHSTRCGGCSPNARYWPKHTQPFKLLFLQKNAAIKNIPGHYIVDNRSSMFVASPGLFVLARVALVRILAALCSLYGVWGSLRISRSFIATSAVTVSKTYTIPIFTLEHCLATWPIL